jgi:hypothetical protein
MKLYKKEITLDKRMRESNIDSRVRQLTESSVPNKKKSLNFLDLTVEARLQIYECLYVADDPSNTTVASRMISQLNIGFSPCLPGAGMLLACKKFRAKGKDFKYSHIHFSTKFTRDSVASLHHFRFGTSQHLIEFIDLQSDSIILGYLLP